MKPIEELQKVRGKHANKTCLDCPNRNPAWCSVPFGIWICMSCAGKHRKLGTHLSFVRSPDYDSWSKEQLTYMQLGGNAPARTYFRKNHLEMESIPKKYGASAAQTYKKNLKEKVEAKLGTTHKKHKKMNIKVTTPANRILDDEDNSHSAPAGSVNKKEDWFSTEINTHSPGAHSTGELSDEQEDDDGWDDTPKRQEQKKKRVVSKKMTTTKKRNAHFKPVKQSKLQKKTKSTLTPSSSTKKTKKTTSGWDDASWDDWGSEEDDKEEVEEDTSNGWKLSHEPKGNMDGVGSSFGARYGYQARADSHTNMASQQPVLRRQDYQVESIAEIEDVDDLKAYARTKSSELAEMGREYGGVAYEKGSEMAAQLSASVTSWWNDFTSG